MCKSAHKKNTVCDTMGNYKLGGYVIESQKGYKR